MIAGHLGPGGFGAFGRSVLGCRVATEPFGFRDSGFRGLGVGFRGLGFRGLGV